MLWILAAASLAAAISGVPFTEERVTGNTTAVKTITATLCRVGGVSSGQETGALVQVASNSIYYTLSSTVGTPGVNGAPQFYAATGDIIELVYPSKFRFIGVTAGVTYNLSVGCFQR